MKHACDNCNWTGEEPDEIDNLEQRVDPGSVVPSGQCPDCGALCYPETAGSNDGTAYVIFNEEIDNDIRMNFATCDKNEAQERLIAVARENDIELDDRDVEAVKGGLVTGFSVRDGYRVELLEYKQPITERERLAIKACELLIGAYIRGGENGGSIDWGDIDMAHEAALNAVGPENRSKFQLEDSE